MSVPFGSDPWLEARLRNVPLPPGMLARLDEIAKETLSEELSGEIASAAELPKVYHPNRPVPVGPSLSDDRMDLILQDVTLPAGLRQRLENISREPQRNPALRRLALAASMLIAIGAAYWAGSGNLLSPQVATNERRADEQPSINSPPFDAEHASSFVGNDRSTAEEAEALASSGATEHTDPAIEAMRWQLMQEADILVKPAEKPEIAENPESENNSFERPNKAQIFASSGVSSKLPPLELVRAFEQPRGIAPPTTTGYDLRFRAKYGENPFVVPRANKNLQVVRVPLVTNTDSYDEARRQVAGLKMPSAEDIVVEQFLAAVNYGFPAPPPAGLGMHLSGGSAPFAAGHHLLQIGVQAPGILRLADSSTVLTVIVQLSDEGDFEANLSKVRRALAELAGKLGPTDQLSLIAAGKQPTVLLELAARKQTRQVLAAIQKVTGNAESNLSAAIEAGIAVTAKSSLAAEMPRRLILLTDGTTLSEVDTKQMEGLLKKAAGQGMKLNVVHLDRVAAKKEVQQLRRVAAAGGGARISADSLAAVRGALLQSLTGVSQTAAKRASLQIRFNSQAVEAYRLIGHETATLTGSSPAPLAVDLQAEETVTALVELRLSPRGGDDIAFVELAWQHAETNQPALEVQVVKRSHFAKDFASSSLPLQSAALVAHTAEILRGSQFAIGNRSLEPVLQLASQSSKRMFQQPSMRAFRSFVEQAETVRLRGTKR